MPMGKSADDSSLFRKIKKGDEEAFELLFYRYYPRLFTFARDVVQSENIANDMVQDVYLKLWEKRGDLRDISVKNLLYTMVRNQCLNYLRNKRVINNKKVTLSEMNQVEELYGIDFHSKIPEKLLEQQLEEEIHHVMNKLPEKSREVFRLSRIKGLKNKEIAEELNVSQKNVEKHISKALQLFRKYFQV
jgi:RNA polymerase sigma-70 factor (ECF subfamily)